MFKIIFDKNYIKIIQKCKNIAVDKSKPKNRYKPDKCKN